MAFILETTSTPPEVISLAKMRKQLQLEDDFTEDDTLISDFIEAAINQAENYINSEITQKTFTVTGKSFEDVLAFKKQKIQAVTSITYKDEAGDSQTVTDTNYSLQTVDKFENSIVFNENFELPKVKEYDPAAVTLNVTVGYAANKVPKAIKQAIILLVAFMYEHRVDSVKEKSTAAETLLQAYRRY